MESFAAFAEAFAGYVWGEPLAWLLTGAGLLFTLMTRNVQLKALTHGFNVIRGKYDNPEDEGNISHFKALCTALSATIGLGNISGVAVAVAAGGAGAVFWMWVVGFLGMATKFMTCSLGTMYRKEDSEGTYRGGPMYYIEIGLGKSWKWLAITFAVLGVLASVGAGNMFQSNQVASIIRDLVVSIEPLDADGQAWVYRIVGITMCVMAGLVMIGGIKRIGNTASKIVPSMCAIYVVAAVYVILTNIGTVPELFVRIFSEAFSGAAAKGAFYGVAFRQVVILGVKRACFSNEAGLGSAPMAHATAKTNEPIREGVVAAVGPFIDTVVICTMTALVVLITDVHARDAIGSVAAVGEVRQIAAEKEGDDPKNGFEVTIQLAEGDFVSKAKGQKIFVGPIKGDLGGTELSDSFVIDRVEGNLCYGTVIVPADPKAMAAFDEKKRPLFVAQNPVFLHKEGVSLTAYAFDQVLPGFGTWFLPLAAFLFAFSTVISWGFYGETCFSYLFGDKALLPFKLVYVSMVLVGTLFTDLAPVLNFSDAMLGLMLIPNMIGTLLLAPRVMRAGQDYFARLKAGEFEEEARRAAEAKARMKNANS